jgi:hypothetical protein
MASYRVLKSVAHNWAHSLLSDNNFAGDAILIQLLLEVARAKQQPELEIDPLEERILPDGLRTPLIDKSLSGSRRHFIDILESQGCAMEMISSENLSFSSNR